MARRSDADIPNETAAKVASCEEAAFRNRFSTDSVLLGSFLLASDVANVIFPFEFIASIGRAVSLLPESEVLQLSSL